MAGSGETDHVNGGDGGPIDYHLLSDRELARLVVADDRAARHEAERRFQPLIVRYAKRFCARLAHRTSFGGACPGFDGCDLAFTAAYEVIRKRIVGVEPAQRRATPDGSKAPRSELERYLRSPRGDEGVAPEERTFAQHLRHCGLHGWQSDILRAWNTERQLLNRVRSNAETKPFEEVFPTFLDHNTFIAALRTLGYELPDGPLRWIDALYTDACQTGTAAPIDTFRAARQLDRRLDQQQNIVRDLGVWESALHDVDNLLGIAAPDYYGRTLGRARSVTRIQTTADGTFGRDDGDDSAWQFYDDELGYEQGWDDDDDGYEGRWNDE